MTVFVVDPTPNSPRPPLDLARLRRQMLALMRALHPDLWNTDTAEQKDAPVERKGGQPRGEDA